MTRYNLDYFQISLVFLVCLLPFEAYKALNKLYIIFFPYGVAGDSSKGCCKTILQLDNFRPYPQNYGDII